MISKIERIRNFGIYKNLDGTFLQEFKEFNLIYGWNYSGKTTLSRIFAALASKEIPKEYNGCEFLVKLSDNSSISQSFESSLNVMVYNEDFKKKHFKWEEDESLNSILIAGKDLPELQSEKKELFKKIIDYEKEIGELEKRNKEWHDRVESAMTAQASQIVNELRLGNRFTKANLRPLINETKSLTDKLLEKDELARAKNTAASANPKMILPEVEITELEVDAKFLAVQQMLKDTPEIENALDYLTKNSEISAWCETGLKLHKGRETCEFCGNIIPASRFNALKSHFSSSFEKFAIFVSIHQRDIESLKLIPNHNSYTKEKFYDEFGEDLVRICRSLDMETKSFDLKIDEIVEVIRKKQVNPFRTDFELDWVHNFSNIVGLKKELGQLVSRNNLKTQDYENARNLAIEATILHYVASFERLHNYKKGLVNYGKNIAEIEKSKNEIEAAKTRIYEIDALISQEVKGAAKINELLATYFRKNDIRVEVRTTDKKYQLMRKGEVAKNLSEGEKTAICFCYFIAKLQETENKFEDTIVFIDDPISSLDSNHILNTYSMIKGSFYKFDSCPTAPKNLKHVILCKQLFISTHNYEFFHLLNDWLKGVKKESLGRYYVERNRLENYEASMLVDCPEALFKYNSEYSFLYLRLKEYASSPSEDFEAHYNIGNMLRRFTEIYLKNKFVTLARIDEHIEKLMVDTFKNERARKFMHFNSHSLNRTSPAYSFSGAETKDIIEDVFEAIKNLDPIHFQAIEDTSNGGVNN